MPGRPAALSSPRSGPPAPSSLRQGTPGGIQVPSSRPGFMVSVFIATAPHLLGLQWERKGENVYGLTKVRMALDRVKQVRGLQSRRWELGLSGGPWAQRRQRRPPSPTPPQMGLTATSSGGEWKGTLGVGLSMSPAMVASRAATVSRLASSSSGKAPHPHRHLFHNIRATIPWIRRFCSSSRARRLRTVDS